MRPDTDDATDVGRWVTIIAAVVYAGVVSFLEIADDLNDGRGLEPRELTRDLIWALSWAWFLANALRALDCMRPSISRITSLVVFGIVVIWISSPRLITYMERNIRSASDVENLSVAIFGFVIGIIALLSVFRHDLLNTPTEDLGDGETRAPKLPSASIILRWLVRTVTHPIRSIMRDPIRWSAIAGAVIWPTASLWVFPSLLVQAIAITCLIRYADTYSGRRDTRIAALTLATGFAWLNFAVTAPFTPTMVAWLGPSLLLWTGSAVLAMFRPHTTQDELVHVDDDLLSQESETAGLGSNLVRDDQDIDWRQVR